MNNPNYISLPKETGKRNMEFNYIPSVKSSNLSLSVTVILFLCLFGRTGCFDEEHVSFNTFTVSSFIYPQTTIREYDLRYIRVELPPWFSSMSLALRSDVDLGTVKLEKVPKSRLPIICFRDGSPPLTDSNGSLTDSGRSVLFPNFNTSFEGIEALRIGEQCYPMQKNMTATLTNEQISPGVWYIGLFNGIGHTRTQSKMIIRGPSYSFSANITVNGCTTSTMWGQYCNQTIKSLSCAPANTFNSSLNLSDPSSYNRTWNYISCKDSFGTSCHGNEEPKVYTLDITGLAEELRITAGNFSGGDSLTCIVRHGAMLSATLHDFSGDIGKGPLVIRLPKIGRWYFAFLPRNLSDHNKVCYAVESNVLQCPLGKSGPNCSWEKHILLTVIRKSSAPFESYYFPVGAKSTSKESSNFLLEPLLTNTSQGEEPSNNTWTYLIMEIPRGAAGGNIRVRLSSDIKTVPEIYARHGGYPSADSWDYYYVNETRSSAGSLFFKVYNSSDQRVDFDILSIKEGTWGFGLRVLNGSKIASQDPIVMSITLERCPKGCSHPHGDCKLALDASGLALYSYCSCDRNHGGFDCSVEIVSHQGHIWQSIFLIASNAAAILPAFWALRQKALAEWVIYTSSGVSSGLYHACDVGSGCALSFNALQFLDFWLSFMAVVSTFVYLVTIKEAYKRAIHAAVAILTAVMAITKATRSLNIILVIVIGSCGLLVGLLVEYSTKLRSCSLLIGVCLSTLQRWEALKGWAHNAVKTMLRRFRWGFMLVGFTALAMAAISWNLESSESYWIWHSIWHVTIYTSSFFFLCSKSKEDNNDDPSPPDQTYELTRQDSAPRGD